MSTVVIIPVLNRRRLVLEALDGVAAQTLPPLLTIVIDDGSTDGTPDAVARWIEAYKGSYRLIRSDGRSGPHIARNIGLAAAPASECVAFLDSDDVWPADFLARAEAALRAAPDVVAVTSDIRLRRPQEDSFRSLASMERAAGPVLFEDAGVGSATLFRADAVRRCGGFDPAFLYSHDSDLFLRVGLLGPWRHLPGAPILKQEGLGGPDENDRHCQSSPNPELRWAMAHERIVARTDLRPLLSRRALRHGMARRWFRAGRGEMRRGRLARARCCFRRALAWRPLHLPARRDFLRLA